MCVVFLYESPTQPIWLGCRTLIAGLLHCTASLRCCPLAGDAQVFSIRCKREKQRSFILNFSQISISSVVNLPMAAEYNPTDNPCLWRRYAFWQHIKKARYDPGRMKNSWRYCFSLWSLDLGVGVCCGLLAKFFCFCRSVTSTCLCGNSDMWYVCETKWTQCWYTYTNRNWRKSHSCFIYIHK